MPFQRSDVTEKFFFFELRLPGTSASFYAIPRSPLSPPLTRGPNQPVNVPAAAGSGGMRASRPTVARVVAAAPVGRASAMVCRGGPWPSRGTLRQCGVPRDDASIVPYIGLWYRRVCYFPVSHSVLPPLSKGGGTAEGRDGGIVLRPDAVSKKRRNGEILLS